MVFPFKFKPISFRLPIFEIHAKSLKQIVSKSRDDSKSNTNTTIKSMLTPEIENAFNTEFDQIKDSLKSFVLRLTANVEDTHDIIQDTWIKGSQNVQGFTGEANLKTWIFSIASNTAKDHLKRSKRWTENTTDICREAAMTNPEFFQEAMAISETSAHGKFEIKEHIAFCFTCIAKSLPIEQHLCLLLKEVHEFKIGEIATILELTEALVKYHIHTARSKMIEVFEGRCALIKKEGICHQCTELNGIFNPKQNSEEEKVKLRLVRDAEKQNKEHLFELRTEILRDIDPFKSGASELQLHHLEHNRQVMENYLEKDS
jgi:RNA polymerase sigma-70 factor (ECF subfamily)